MALSGSERLVETRGYSLAAAREIVGLSITAALTGCLAIAGALANARPVQPNESLGPVDVTAGTIRGLSYGAIHEIPGVVVTLPDTAFSRPLMRKYVDAARSQVGLKPIHASLALNETAQASAEEIAQANRLAIPASWAGRVTQYLHQEHPNHEETAMEVVVEYDPNSGDNIGQMMERWVTSPYQAQYLFDGSYSEVGFGQAQMRDGQEVVVADFAGLKTN